MPSRSIRIALLMAAFAFMPAALQARPARHVAALRPSNSALDFPIEDIAASSSGRAILDKDFPGLCTQSMYGAFKALSLNQIAAVPRTHHPGHARASPSRFVRTPLQARRRERPSNEHRRSEPRANRHPSIARHQPTEIGERTTFSFTSPWHIVNADNKERARLNCIAHLLHQIPYNHLRPVQLELPLRQPDSTYIHSKKSSQRWVEER